MSIHARIIPLEWENQFFLRYSAQLVWNKGSLLESSQLDDFDIIQAKVDSRKTVEMDALQKLGFRLVEGEVNLQFAITTTQRQVGIGIRIARQEDISILRTAAGSAFSFSRFRPPWYLPHDSARFYAQWIENAVLGTFDNQCLIAYDNYNKLQGFVSLRKTSADSARIGLLTTSPKVQRKGVGTRLILAAKAWLQERGLTRLSVTTQLSNQAALRFYTRCGAVVNSVAYWFYR